MKPLIRATATWVCDPISYIGTVDPKPDVGCGGVYNGGGVIGLSDFYPPVLAFVPHISAVNLIGVGGFGL